MQKAPATFRPECRLNRPHKTVYNSGALGSVSRFRRAPRHLNLLFCMTSRPARLCFAVACSALVGGAPAQTPPPLPTNPPTAAPGTTANASGDEELVQLKLPDADIDTVLSALEIYTGRIILRPQQLQTATYN